jgi:hypothetical protein
MDRTQIAFASDVKAVPGNVKVRSLLKGFLWFAAAFVLSALLLWASLKYGLPMTEDTWVPLS